MNAPTAQRSKRLRWCACGTVHGRDQVRAIGRFRPQGPLGYIPVQGGTLRSSRSAAQQDVCPYWTH